MEIRYIDKIDKNWYIDKKGKKWDAHFIKTHWLKNLYFSCNSNLLKMFLRTFFALSHSKYLAYSNTQWKKHDTGRTKILLKD